MATALSFLHSPTLTLIHEHWKNHSLDWLQIPAPHKLEAEAGTRVVSLGTFPAVTLSRRPR